MRVLTIICGLAILSFSVSNAQLVTGGSNQKLKPVIQDVVTGAIGPIIFEAGGGVEGNNEGSHEEWETGGNNNNNGGTFGTDGSFQMNNGRFIDLSEFNRPYSSQTFSANSLTLTVFPNPAKDEVNLQFSQSIIPNQVRIYNLAGQEIFKQDYIDQMSVKVNTSLYPSGMYIVQLRNGNQVETSKLKLTH